MSMLRTVAPADIIIKNARIATLTKGRPFVSALAVKDGLILSTGSERQVLATRGPRTAVVDAGGRTVVPGLNDAHTHFIRTGLNYAMELRWDGVPSLALALDMLRQQAARTPPPNWVQVVGGWSAFQFAERRLPTLGEINAATGDTPAYVLHLYDRCFLNRAALRALGFTRDTADPPGGYLERDAKGDPTGLIVSTTSLASVVFVQGRIPRLSPEDQKISTRRFMAEMNRLGVTSVSDAGGAGQSFPEDYARIKELAAERLLTLRIGYTLFCQRPGMEIDDYRKWVEIAEPGDGNEYLRMSGGGEYLVWSATDPANFAKRYVPQPLIMESQLEEVLRLIASRGWPFRLHATYDESVRRILGVLEKVHRDVPIDALRWTIDHAETVSPDSLRRIAALGGGVCIQNRMSLDGEAFVKRLGERAAADAPPVGRILSMGIPLSCGTDGTRCTSYNPWIGLYWLVTGKTLGGLALQAERNLVDRMEALRLYSAAGAWFTREEDRKGTLEPGKWADLAVLSADYFSVAEEEIKNIDSVLTMVGGKVVYGRIPFTELAPPPIPSAADWLPVEKWPGYFTAGDESASGQAPTAAACVAADGRLWSLDCGCAFA